MEMRAPRPLPAAQAPWAWLGLALGPRQDGRDGIVGTFCRRPLTVAEMEAVLGSVSRRRGDRVDGHRGNPCHESLCSILGEAGSLWGPVEKSQMGGGPGSLCIRATQTAGTSVMGHNCAEVTLSLCGVCVS